MASKSFETLKETIFPKNKKLEINVSGEKKRCQNLLNKEFSLLTLNILMFCWKKLKLIHKNNWKLN